MRGGSGRFAPYRRTGGADGGRRRGPLAATAAAAVVSVAAVALVAQPATASDPARGTATSGARGTARGAARDAAVRPAGTATSDVHLRLPAPTGPYAVGTVSLHLVDRSRSDPWVPVRPYRELMVSVWYPAVPAADRPLAPHMLPGAAAHFGSFAGTFNYSLPDGRVDWARTRTHAREGAPVDRSAGRLPVVLYSPGAADPRTWGTALVEDLASRGYAVVTVDHTYEASEVEFPGGRVETSVLLDALRHEDVLSLTRKVLTTRVADVRYVLDQLAALAGGGNPDVGRRALPGGLGRALDLHRVGVFGQSGGGFTAAQAMHDDPRIAAGVDLDGQLAFGSDDDGSNLSSVATDGLDRPFLLVGSTPGGHTVVPSWRAFWANSRGWHRDLYLTGSAHGSFTDAEPLVPQIAAQVPLPDGTVSAAVGSTDPARAVAANRAYVAAFFDRWLRGRNIHLLDGPSAAYPEVRFVS